METRIPGLVSVITPAYNASAYIADAIASALGQTYRDVEVIVTDDGSTDRTPDILASYAGSITVVNQPNSGQAAARNAGVRSARGEFIAFLDADDVWHPDKLARQVEVLRTHPEYGLVHTKAGHIDADGRPVWRPIRPWDGQAHGRCTLELIDHCSITASSALVRRAALDPEPFRTGIDGCEDWDLWLRLSLKWPFAYLDERVTDYRVHGANVSSAAVPMLRASIGVLERFLREDLEPLQRRTVSHRLRIMWVDLAHQEYERGNLKEARRLFAKEATALDRRALARFAATLLPTVVRSTVRELCGRSVARPA